MSDPSVTIAPVPPALAYADPITNAASRGRCRLARVALLWVLVAPAAAVAPLLVAVHQDWVGDHFLCCDHPALTLLAFAGLPAAGSVMGTIALLNILSSRSRPRPRGLVSAVAAMLVGGAMTAVGFFFSFALRA